MDKLGGRKFLMAVVLLVLNFILFYTGRIDSESWKFIVMALFGVYVTGNAVSKLMK